MPLLIPVVYVVRKLRGFGSGVWSGVVSVLVWAAVWMPWTARNYLAYGAPILITCGGGLNFYLGNNPFATWNSKTDVPKPPTMQNLRSEHPHELEREFYRMGLEYVRSNPIHAAGLWLGKLINYWHPVPEIKNHRIGTLKMIAAVGPSTLVLLAGLCAAVSAWRRRDWSVLFLLGIPLIDSCLTAAFITPARLRIPFDAVLIVAAAAWFAAMSRPVR